MKKLIFLVALIATTFCQAQTTQIKVNQLPLVTAANDSDGVIIDSLMKKTRLIRPIDLAKYFATSTKVFYLNNTLRNYRLDTNTKFFLDSIDIPINTLKRDGAGFRGLISYRCDSTAFLYMSLSRLKPMDSSKTQLTYDSLQLANAGHSILRSQINFTVAREDDSTMVISFLNQGSSISGDAYHVFKYQGGSKIDWKGKEQKIYFYSRQLLYHKELMRWYMDMLKYDF